jgi:hypothetical protein
MTLGEPQTGYENWSTVDGEATVLARSLTPQVDSYLKDYDMYVLVDCNVAKTDNTVIVVPLIMVVTSDTALNPAVTLIGGGKRVLNTDKGVFAGWVVDGQFVGWTKTHASYSVTVYDVLWSNTSKFKLEVNDSSLGYTDPSAGEYDKKAVESTTVTAYPYSGCSVKNWELDGVQYPANNTFTVKHYRDHVLVCVFVRGGTLLFRPSSNGDLIQLTAIPTAPNYQNVDDEVSDGGATIVYNAYVNTKRTDLYGFTFTGIPSNAIIDYVDVFIRVRRVPDIYQTAECNTALKTHGTIYYGEPYYPPYDLDWHLTSTRYTTNPYTKQPWTLSEVYALQAGVRLQNWNYWGTYVSGQCTQMWVEVAYHVP